MAALAGQRGDVLRVEHRAAAGQGDHRAVVVAVDDRLDAVSRCVGAGVHVRDEADGTGVVARRRQRRRHVPVGVEGDVVEPRRDQLVDKQPREVELTGGARTALAVPA